MWVLVVLALTQVVCASNVRKATPPLCFPKADDGSAQKDSYGKRYSLAPLIKRGSDAEWVAKDNIEHDEYVYTINVCTFIHSISTARSVKSAVWQTKGNGLEEKNCGIANSDVKFVEDGILTLTYEGGDTCPAGNATRSSTITFYCDPVAPVDSGPALVKNENDCSFVFIWETPYACGLGKGKSSSGKHGKPILITFILIILCYLIGGALFQFFVRKETGLHLIPNYVMWSSLFTTIAAGISAGLKRAGAGRGRQENRATEAPLLDGESDESDSDDDQLLHV
eukprot:CFRG2020T1